ncbi:hypothetical protein IT397_02115 [Candidatus Nomurabacteria bacterium]|nr:hypothetical protein [Candidatus Nomurabacteria bacterium]
MSFFKKIINKNKLHHAYFLEGKRIAIISELNSFLESELKFEINNNPDYICREYEVFGIDEAREIIDIHSKKALGEFKIFIIAFHFITHQAQNALLKILEEPSSNSHFFLVSKSIDDFLPTLKSRLERVDARKIVGEDIWPQEAEKFLKLSLKDKLSYSKNFSDQIKDEESSKSDVVCLIDEIKKILVKRMSKEKSKEIAIVLEKIIKLKKYLSSPSASVKMILDSVSILLS